MIFMEQEFYCVVGKHKVKAEAELVTMANRKKAYTGVCPEHNNKLFKFTKTN